MTRAHVGIARAIEDMTIGEICVLVETSGVESDVPVMERLLIGAMSAPRLVTFIQTRFSAEEIRNAR